MNSLLERMLYIVLVDTNGFTDVISSESLDVFQRIY